MLRAGDKIKVHIFDTMNKEIITNNHNAIFEVVKHPTPNFIDCSIGIYWTADKFAPFNEFSHNAIFENVNTGKQYNYSNIYNGLCEV